MLDNQPSNAAPHSPDPVTMQNVGPSANQPEVFGDEYGFGGPQAYADAAGAGAGAGGGCGYRDLPIQLQDPSLPDPYASLDDGQTPHMPMSQPDPCKHRRP
jgi:hypothetical protein